MKNDFDKSILEDVVEKLKEMEDDTYIENSTTPYDLSFALWEEENNTGSITCNTYESQIWIGIYFMDIADYVDKYEEEFEETLNCFKSPEAFQVIITIFATKCLLTDFWDEGISKERLIEAIEEEIK